MKEQRYATPADFRQALTERLRAIASERKWPLQQLQRQFAYDRLLERLYLRSHGWVIKGAAALLARDLGVRATIDIDVYREIEQAAAEAELRDAAALDIGDWFRFEVGERRPAGDRSASLRLPVTAYVGTTIWCPFHVDVVGADLRMTAEPEEVPSMVRIDIDGVEQHGYRAYPLVDHVADKVAATFELHGSRAENSTRFKDLIDLVAIARGAKIDAGEQSRAIRSELKRRGVALPRQFDVPDRRVWEEGYAAEAERCLVPVPATLSEAMLVVRPFLDPLLDGTAKGTWDPIRGKWVPL